MGKKKNKKYAVRSPLNVKGGIRAQALRAEPLRVWWSRRWTTVLETFRMGPRFGRGRHYAVSGQTSDLTLAAGSVAASVQGTVAEPYRCEATFTHLGGTAKARVVAALRQRPMLLARLLAGDLPHETEALFRAENCPLFPERENDLKSRCSCPDWANPCKHLAAVYCLLGETIAKNPLTLLALRGVTRADLVEYPMPDTECPAPKPGTSRGTGAGAPPPLTREAFYGKPSPPLTDFGAAPKTDVAAPLVHRLGPLPFWRGQDRFADTLEHLAHRAAARGWSVWTGEPLDLRPPTERVVIKGATLRLKHTLRIDRN